ncbi:hypothetical protein C8Q74DRAFT_1367964 [Fomes fomentarius]|nr:hypothetical protein C8Q74DRAFT_1367964 [Fomes fomentarius]
MLALGSFVTLALIFSASASPPAADIGTHIDFQRRDILIDENGYFNHLAAIEQVGANILPYATYTPDRTKRNTSPLWLPPPATFTPSSHDRCQAEPLTDVRESYWPGPNSVGTPEKGLVMDFDGELIPSGALGTQDAVHTSPDSRIRRPLGYVTVLHKLLLQPEREEQAQPRVFCLKKDDWFAIHYGDGSKVAGPRSPWPVAGRQTSTSRQ